jgi:2-polyprenyl-3-methyl-5-hydroxy-6-metoxy-1,4-benzoquinol methylase
VLEAFRTGGGVPYKAYGEDLRRGIARLNQPMFLHQLTADWIPALPDIQARLQSTETRARVADLGCGCGWSSIALARAYPNAYIDGIDLDEASVTEARRNAAAAGVADRVRFACRNAGNPALPGRYNLVTFFETLHDLADPVAALRATRRSHPPSPHPATNLSASTTAGARCTASPRHSPNQPRSEPEP